jgi:hypothetical protein
MGNGGSKTRLKIIIAHMMSVAEDRKNFRYGEIDNTDN